MDPSPSPRLTGWDFFRSRRFLRAALYLLLMGYFYSFSQYGFNIWDEGGFANGTLRTLNGEQALVDFNPNGYLPGRYLYGAIFFKLFGIDIRSLRLAVILLTPGMVFMVYAASRKLMPAGFAFLAALCMLSAPSMYYNRFYPFFCVLNLFCLLRVVERFQASRLVLLGSVIVLTGFFKFEIALISLIVSLVLMGVMLSRPAWRMGFPGSQKPGTGTGAFGAGTLSRLALIFMPVLFLALAAFFIKNDFFVKVFRLVVDAHGVWGNPFPEIFPFHSLLERLGPHQMFERILFYLPLWVYGITGALLLVRLLQKNWKPEIGDLHLLVVLSFGIGSFGLVIWRAGFDNLLRTLPPFYILFCYLLFWIHERVLRLPVFPDEKRAGVFPWRKIPVNVAAVCLPFMFCYEMNVNHGFYAGTIGAVQQETQRIQLDRMDVYTNPAEAGWIKDVVERIEIYSDRGDPILALPLNPIFYFLTGRVNPTRYDWILPGMLDGEEEKKVVERLRTQTPKLIVYVDIPIDGKEERRLLHYAPRVFRFIEENYQFEERIGLFQILLPRNLEPTAMK